MKHLLVNPIMWYLSLTALEGSVEIDEFNFPKTRYFKGNYQAINEALSEVATNQ